MASRHNYQAVHKHHSRPSPAADTRRAERDARIKREVKRELLAELRRDARQTSEQHGRVTSWLEGVSPVGEASAPAARPGEQTPRSKPLPPLPPSSSPQATSSPARCPQQQQSQSQQQQPAPAPSAPAVAAATTRTQKWIEGDPLRRELCGRMGPPDAGVGEWVTEWLARGDEVEREEKEEKEEKEKGEEEEGRGEKWERRWGVFRELVRGERGERKRREKMEAVRRGGGEEEEE